MVTVGNRLKETCCLFVTRACGRTEKNQSWVRVNEAKTIFKLPLVVELWFNDS